MRARSRRGRGRPALAGREARQHEARGCHHHLHAGRHERTIGQDRVPLVHGARGPRGRRHQGDREPGGVDVTADRPAADQDRGAHETDRQAHQHDRWLPTDEAARGRSTRSRAGPWRWPAPPRGNRSCARPRRCRRCRRTSGAGRRRRRHATDARWAGRLCRSPNASASGSRTPPATRNRTAPASIGGSVSFVTLMPTNVVLQMT